MADRKSYILPVGSNGRDRLAKLNKMLSPSTYHFFQKMGLKEGQKVLEIGCGTGNVTSMIAHQVGPSGHVTAIDVNAEQIEVAREQIKLKNITNVSFYNQSVLDPFLFVERFDVVYSRLTIMHVSNFQLALKNMYAALADGGILACEEASNARYIHYPYNAAYDKSRILLIELSKIKGMDPYIGDKIFGFFQQLKLTGVAVDLVQPIYQTEEERSILQQFFDEVKCNYIKHELITDLEASKMSEEIRRYAMKGDNFITFPSITQIWARKL